MSEEREAIWKCEYCAKPIYEGDNYGSAVDGPEFCEDHAYSLSDVIEQHEDILSKVPWNPGDLNYSDRAEMRTACNRMKAELAANGDHKILQVA